MKEVLKLRYKLIRLLIGKLPVCMNMRISTPEGFEGTIFSCSINDKGLLVNNCLSGNSSESIMEPWKGE